MDSWMGLLAKISHSAVAGELMEESESFINPLPFTLYSETPLPLKCHGLFQIMEHRARTRFWCPGNSA